MCVYHCPLISSGRVCSVGMSLFVVCARRSLNIIPRTLCNAKRYNLVTNYIPARFAGHSHWQNVRHTKEAKDKERMRITTNYLMQIDAAIKRK